MIAADIGSKPELVLRYLTIFLGAVFMTWATRAPLIAIWLAGFLVTNGAYSLWLSRLAPPVPQSTYVQLVALLEVSVLLYTSCAIYLFLLGTPAMTTIAIASLAAQSLFNLSRHRHSTFTAFFDTAVVTGTGLFFGLSALVTTPMRVPEQMIVIVCTLGVCGYYVIAQYRNILVNRRLIQAQKETIQTQKNQAIGQLSAGVAHDFNNLLTVIRGNMELAQLAQDPVDRSALLDDAITAADRASTLTSQLLAFSRKAHLEASHVPLETFWAEMGVLIHSVVPATIVIETHQNADVECVYCDRTQLESAVINLVMNALDAMEGPGNLALISRRCTPRELAALGRTSATRYGYAAIEIRDTGTGIPSDLLDMVTQPFFSTKSAGNGSGLGLSMVKGFAEQSGGCLIIQSDGSGTSVSILLPTGV